MLALQADLSDPEQTSELVDCAARELGSLMAQVNNAGATMTGPSLNLALQDWQRALDLDPTAPSSSAPRQLPAT